MKTTGQGNPTSYFVIFIRHLRGEKQKDIAAEMGVTPSNISAKYLKAARAIGYTYTNGMIVRPGRWVNETFEKNITKAKAIKLAKAIIKARSGL